MERNKKTFYLTYDGLKEVKKRYFMFKKSRYAKLRNGVPPSFESDTINSDYLFFLQDLEIINKKIEDLKEILENAKIISAPPEKVRNTVSLGAEVVLKNNSNQTERLQIVGTAETDPSKGKISNESPLGKILLGKTVGDRIYSPVAREEKYTIQEISY